MKLAATLALAWALTLSLWGAWGSLTPAPRCEVRKPVLTQQPVRALGSWRL